MSRSSESLSLRVRATTKTHATSKSDKPLKASFPEAPSVTEMANRNTLDLRSRARDLDQSRNVKKEVLIDKPSFEFVTLTTQPSASTRSASSKKVRTQAMRDYLRKQNRQAISGVIEVVERSNPEEPAQYKGKFKLSSWTHKSKEKSDTVRREKLLSVAVILPNVNSGGDEDSVPSFNYQEDWRTPQTFESIFTLSSGSLDPFDTLSIKLGPHSHRLLAYYNTAYTTNSIAINAVGDFFSHVKTDPALFHSILYLVALHSDLTHGIADSPAGLYHGSEAFRLINERLRDRSGVFSDETMAAVAMLVNKENLNGRYDLSEMHKQGLEKMIQTRGGVHVLHGVFRRIVTWSDFCYANVWSCQPSFPRLLSRSTIKKSTENNSTLLRPSHLFGASSPIVPIFHELRDLSESVSPPNIKKLDRMQASNAIYNLEYDLLLLNKQLPAYPETFECIFSFEAVPLKTAAHIYLWLAIRELPPTSELLYRLVQRLKGSLIGTLPGWWISTRERQVWLLWILFIGGIAAVGRPERLWFVGEMVKICKAMGVLDEYALRSSLKTVLWQDEFCGEKIVLVWQDVVFNWNIEEDYWTVL